MIATNPVDVLTYTMQELSKRPKSKIIGTGTMLDTSRLRQVLGSKYNVNPKSVHGYILGEHGDSELAAWSTCTIGGLPLKSNSACLGIRWNEEEMEQLFIRVRDAAQEIIAAKGYTNLAIGCVLKSLIECILHDSRSILPVSVRLEGEYDLNEVCLSVPCRIGKDGIDGRPIVLELEETEKKALHASAAVLKGHIKGMNLGSNL